MRTIPIDDESRVGEARRLAMADAARAGCGADQRERVGLVVTELAYNVLHHAQDGEVLIRVSGPPETPKVEVIAVDAGPGIPSVDRAMVDGFTTRGTGRRLGAGLGGVRRLSDGFDIYTDPAGTTVAVRLGGGAADLVDGLVIPKPGEASSGDGWAARRLGDGAAVMLVDALGHGEKAARAAEAAIGAFTTTDTRRIEDVIDSTLVALASERGAAALFVELPPGAPLLRAWGLGNIRGELLDGSARSGIVSNPGVAGRSERAPKPLEYSWSRTSLLVLATDGLKEGGRDGLPPALRARTPLVVAATLMKRRRRGTDDAGVVVVKGAPAPAMPEPAS